MEKNSGEIKFIAESSLGRLAKWLKILGFDTLYDKNVPNRHLFCTARQHHRILLSRTRWIRKKNSDIQMIFIVPNDPLHQLKQVILQLNITKTDIHPLTRCIHCNVPLLKTDKTEIYGKVPEYIFKTQPSFHQCPVCQKIYWSGSHKQKILSVVSAIFETG